METVTIDGDEYAALEDLDILEITAENATSETWFYDEDKNAPLPGFWYGFSQPGCLFDGEPQGPYSTAEKAETAAYWNHGNPVFYNVGFMAFCGMATISETFDTLAEARKYAARILRRRRKGGHYCSRLDGLAWECSEPENSAMVPDTAGILSIEKTVEG